MRINIAGHRWLWYDGYGRFSLGATRGLIRAGHSVYPFELGSLSEKPAWYLCAQGLDFSCTTVQLAPPHNFQHLPGRSVAWTMHETLTLPPGWADHINHKTQLLLVPTPSLIEVFKEGGVKVPIEVVPGGIDPDECPILTRPRSEPYTFLCLADRGNRKGYDLAWTAFYKIFPYSNKDVRLLIKCRPGSLSGLDFSYSTDARLTLWRADVERVADVYSQVDAFIFPSRFEGYGMPPREAAACGVPTVVTRFSGTADDCDEWAIPLNNFKLVESYMDGCGGKWAEPNLDEVCEKMLWLYEHQDEARKLGLKAAAWMRANQTYDHAAQKLVRVLNKHLGGPPPEPEPTPSPEEQRRSFVKNRREFAALQTALLPANGKGAVHE